jgi:hypothetical protein
LFLLRTALETKKILRPAFLKRLSELRPLLMEAATILSWEPQGSIEHARYGRLQGEVYLISFMEKIILKKCSFFM